MSSNSSSTSDSTSSSSETPNEYSEIEKIIDYALHTYVPEILSATTSRHRRKPHVRDREGGHNDLVNDYFATNSVYPAEIFRRRFRMRQHVFLRIVQALEAYDPFFQQRRDATGRLGLSALQKCTAAIRMLAYGTPADMVDEYLRLSESTALRALKKFTEGIIAQFGEEYLRTPTAADLERLLHIGEYRGFIGMVGSIDCMHWEWKNCPAAWKGQYQGRNKKATIVLEAVASQDLWIWHAFFGIPGSCNDLNVLYRSPVFDEILNGRAPPVNFVVNGHEYNMGYYLTDGIYPPWAAFISSIPLPQTRKQKLFAEHQEAARKDVERAFGVLQSRFSIIRYASLALDQAVLSNIMLACIIMHNMIVEDERDSFAAYDDITEFIEDRRSHTTGTSTTNINDDFEFSTERIVDFNRYLANRDRVRDREKHKSLKLDLIENIWQRYG